jgi:hypothetical protein
MEARYTKHAYKRMQERGLQHYHGFIRDIVEKSKDMLSEKPLLMHVGNIAIVASKEESPKVITVWEANKDGNKESEYAY